MRHVTLSLLFLTFGSTSCGDGGSDATNHTRDVPGKTTTTTTSTTSNVLAMTNRNNTDTSADPGTSTQSIKVPRLTLSAASLTFAFSSDQKPVSQVIFLENTGTISVPILGFDLFPSNQTAFSLSFPTDLDDVDNLEKQSQTWQPLLPPKAANVPNQHRMAVRVTFRPQSSEVVNANLIVRSGDPAAPEQTISLVSEAGPPCPVAVAKVVKSDQDGNSVGEASALVTISPGQSVRVMGGESRTAGGESEGLQYVWSVVEQPANAQVDLGQDAMTREFTFSPRFAGVYLLELRVVDRAGVESCEPSQVSVVSTPKEDVAIVLSWEAPNEDRNTGLEADLDLHYLHPNAMGRWGDKRWSVYWNQKVQDWGVFGSEEDDPYLIFDSQNSLEGEMLIQDRPEEGANYDIGVSYHGQSDAGPSKATVSIFLKGELRFESKPKVLKSKDFWFVGSVRAASGEIVIRDEIIPTPEGLRQ